MSDVLVYAQGQTATITANFVTSPQGMPVDVPDATIEVIGPGASQILPPTPMIKVVTGFYYYDYVIPLALPLNTYTILISGTVMGTPTSMITYIQIVQAGTYTPVTASQVTIGLVASLEKYIGVAQRIPVYREIGQKNSTGTMVRFTWPRWNLANHIVRLNGNQMDVGYTINLDNGTITFTAPLHSTDVVDASYNFRFFTLLDEIGFLSDALGQINIEPPQSISFNLDNYPAQFDGVLMQGAAKNALKALLFNLAFQEPSTIFGGPDRVKDAISTFQSLKENFEKEFTADKATLKTKGSYPKVSAIVQPEFTLPGGRCLTPYTVSTYIIQGLQVSLDIKTAYVLHLIGFPLQVLAQNDETGVLTFSSIAKIWKTESKIIWRMETEKGLSVESSSDHLFFTNNEYLPMKWLTKGDPVVVLDESNQAVSDKIKRIIKTNEVIEMYDMEVPETANFFADGIKCHNSRWFRYLFSSNVG